MNTINYLAIITASLVSFIISSIWYSQFLFGKEWMSLVKISSDEIKTNKLGKSYIIQLISTIITFTILAFIINTIDGVNASDGAFIGLLTWLGFVLSGSVSNLIWKKESLSLVLIESINNLLILTIGGAIIGAW